MRPERSFEQLRPRRGRQFLLISAAALLMVGMLDHFDDTGLLAGSGGIVSETIFQPVESAIVAISISFMEAFRPDPS